MFLVFVTLFIFLPLAEIAVLIKAGSLWGVSSTLLLIIFTGILGAYLARTQGLKTLFDIQNDLNQGIMPGGKLIEGAMILAAGLVLLTPGFITDAIGFFILWPRGRQWLRQRLTDYFQSRTHSANKSSSHIRYYKQDDL